MTIRQRFWSKVLIARGCWLWQGSMFPKGYGAFGIRASHVRRAHCFAYELVHGVSVRGQLVLHKCGNKRCVRPSHLYLGTHAQNMADREAHGRTVRGEMVATAKLTREEADEIKVSGLPQRTLARLYGISASQVGNVRRGRSWK